MKLKSFFRSSGYLADSFIKSDSGKELDLKDLPDFLRTLLVTDGTVTKSLEAWFWEPVIVKVSRNECVALSKSLDGLEANFGDKVLQREVSLCGKKTERVFSTAQSTIALQFLPEDVSESLEKGSIGIGEILRDKGLETYRDIFKLNYLPNYQPTQSLSDELSGEIISRSYRIWVNERPAIIVNEFFSINFYNESE